MCLSDTLGDNQHRLWLADLYPESFDSFLQVICHLCNQRQIAWQIAWQESPCSQLVSVMAMATSQPTDKWWEVSDTRSPVEYEKDVDIQILTILVINVLSIGRPSAAPFRTCFYYQFPKIITSTLEKPLQNLASTCSCSEWTEVPITCS